MSHSSPSFWSEETSTPSSSSNSGQKQSVPSAPYPPFLVPPANALGSSGKPVLRSSLSSSPHYSTSQHTEPTTSSTFAAANQYLHQHSSPIGTASPTAAKEPSTSIGNDPSTGRRTRSRSLGEQNDRRSPRASTGPGSGGNRLICPSRVQFSPIHTDVYACINCNSPELETDDFTKPPEEKPVPGVRPKKVGPILLELRRLHLVNDIVRRQDGQLFQSSTLAISRGNPQLGPSVASTCLSFHPSVVSTWGGDDPIARSLTCATGLTTGSLCVHNFQYDATEGGWSSSPDYFTPRHQRLASAVAWRPSNTQHVAIGHVGGPGLGMRRGVVGSRAGGGDRDFCCLLWDVETQAHSTVKGTANTPVSKLSHNAGVASLAWLQEGQTLAVGCQLRTVQIYDLRASGTSAPPISTWAHAEGVNGIYVDPHRPNVFATFSRSLGEPVKLWDARRMDSSLGEIKTSGLGQQQDIDETQEGPSAGSGPASLFGMGITDGSVVSTIRWSFLYPDTLFVAIGDSIRHYETSSGSRPVLTHINPAVGPVLDVALHQRRNKTTLRRSVNLRGAVGVEATKSADESMEGQQLTASEEESSELDVTELQSHRMLVALSDGNVQDMPKFPTAPLAVSRRDGRIVHALGRTVWIGSTSVGPSAMESVQFRRDEDVSATMMRRARCLHSARYSMDAAANIQMLSEENPIGIGSDETTALQLNREELLRLWSWVERVESLCAQETFADETNTWFAKGLIDAGAWKLLGMDRSDQEGKPDLDESTFSDSLFCTTYDSASRRAALTACGWTGRFALSEVLADCEALVEFERSAALAVWHGDIGAAVEALQRGSDAIRSNAEETSTESPRYAETLQLVSMCIAGYNGTVSSSSVWRRACTSLLERKELSGDRMKLSGVAYLRGLCTFLINIGHDAGLDKVLYDDHLSLCDRVAFACRFLDRKDLRSYLIRCIEKCQKTGNLEGLAVTGLEQKGVGILQSYADRSADVQTVALVCSRVIMPTEWVSERAICSEFVDSYRDLLNTWQMWQSRAMFDVDRAELLRRIKVRQSEETQVPTAPRGAYYQSRGRGLQSVKKQGYSSPSLKQNSSPAVLPSKPAQLEARCNYCSMPLSGLLRQEGISNQWLNKLKPVLQCCPRCRKPLPRCAICLLSLGCLNPYMELKRAGNRQARGGAGLQAGEDLSTLANLPFAEWFTWCMRCKHGGHAHHLVGWFANHDVCPVSGCDCRCQFDGIQKLNRPALEGPDTKSNDDD